MLVSFQSDVWKDITLGYVVERIYVWEWPVGD